MQDTETFTAEASLDKPTENNDLEESRNGTPATTEEAVSETTSPSPPRIKRQPSQAERNMSNPNPAPLYKIVLTGGPCGGKTTALARLSSYLRERGFEVMTCPEAFSILIANGMSMDYYAAVSGIATVVQNSVMNLQANLEDGFESILRARGKPSVLLCDRGLMDGSAYMDEADWEELLQKKGIPSVCEIREGRYNAVYHLVTAAEGAERYYTLENNVVRTETPELARKLDKLTRTAWVGHPKLCVFDNSTDFEGKLQRVVTATAQLVGLPSKLQRMTTKFLLRSRPDLSKFPADLKYHIFEVEKVYLYDDDSGKRKEDSEYAEEYSFIRRRSQGKGAAYGQTTVKRTKEGQEIELKRIITRREYQSAYKSRDLSRHIIRQKRICFIWKMQSINIHIYQAPVDDISILHCQVEGANGNDDGDGGGNDVSLPPFLDVERRLRGDRDDKEKYGAFGISLIDKREIPN